jgi:hypothetical protein
MYNVVGYNIIPQLKKKMETKKKVEKMNGLYLH